jgi:general secretion pathway protein L
MWAVYMIAPLKIEGKRLMKLDQEISVRKSDVKRVESLKKDIVELEKEIGTINDFKKNRAASLDIIKELTNIIPHNTWFTRMRITNLTVELEGYAESATSLLPKLEASKYFKKVEFSSPVMRDVKKGADRFVIRMEIEGAKIIEPAKKKKSKEESDE